MSKDDDPMKEMVKLFQDDNDREIREIELFNKLNESIERGDYETVQKINQVLNKEEDK